MERIKLSFIPEAMKEEWFLYYVEDEHILLSPSKLDRTMYLHCNIQKT